MGSAPVWQRVLGGVVGLAAVGGLIWFARSRGVSAEMGQRWEEALVLAVAAVGVGVFMWRRSTR